MKKPFVICLLMLAASCAHKGRSIVDEVNEGNISTQTVLDLARSSYLKGCVDGKNAFAKEVKESSFEKCRDMAMQHQEEIRYIIEQNPAPVKNP